MQLYDTISTNYDTITVLDPTKYWCEVEDCPERHGLVERYRTGEEGEVYYAIKCKSHWAKSQRMREVER